MTPERIKHLRSLRPILWVPSYTNEVLDALTAAQAHIAELEAENARLRKLVCMSNDNPDFDFEAAFQSMGVS